MGVGFMGMTKQVLADFWKIYMTPNAEGQVFTPDPAVNYCLSLLSCKKISDDRCIYKNVYHISCRCGGDNHKSYGHRIYVYSPCDRSVFYDRKICVYKKTGHSPCDRSVFYDRTICDRHVCDNTAELVLHIWI